MNLLSAAFNASSFNKYAIGLFNIMFTETEQAEGFIIDGASSSKKKPLDQTRLNLLYSAVVAKYGAEGDKKIELINDVKRILKTKCSDTKKKLMRKADQQ